jgi:hypothetical protein
MASQRQWTVDSQFLEDIGQIIGQLVHVICRRRCTLGAPVSTVVVADDAHAVTE